MPRTADIRASFWLTVGHGEAAFIAAAAAGAAAAAAAAAVAALLRVLSGLA